MLSPRNVMQNSLFYIVRVIVQTQVHTIFYFIILILRTFQCLTMLNKKQTSQIFENILVNGSNRQIFLIIFLVIQLSAVMVAIYGIFLGRKLKKNNQKNEWELNLSLIVRKIFSYLLLIFRFVLVIPMTYVCAYSLINANTQVNDGNIALALSNLIIMFGLLYPLSGLNFWSKIVINKSVISYAYLVNLQTLNYIYLPLMTILVLTFPTAVIYIGCIYCLIAITCMYFRPLITFSFQKISKFGNSSIVGIIFTASLYDIFQISTENIGEIIFLFVINSIFSAIFYRFMSRRISKILKDAKFKGKENNSNLYGEDQTIFYHLINFQKCNNQLIVFLLSNRFRNDNSPYLAEQKIKQQQTQEKSPNYKHVQRKQPHSQFHQISLQILQILKNNQNSIKQVQKHFNELIICYFKSKYDPHYLMKQKMGRKKLSKQIFHSPKIYIFIAQMLMLGEKNLRKSYYLIKTQETLLREVHQVNLFSRFQISALLLIIENEFLQQSKVSSKFNSKADYYLKFHENLQSLREKISKSCEVSLDFWHEINNKEPDSQKIKRLIQTNFYCVSRVQSQYQDIVLHFEKKSYLLLFQMLYAYNQNVLNDKIPALMNPYNDLLKNVKEEIAQNKKEGADKIDSQNQRQFSLLQKVGVCIIELQGEVGKICWGNTYFWQSFYDKQDKKNQNTNSQENILNLILPQLRKFHLNKLENNRQEEYDFNYKHAQTLLYKASKKSLDNVKVQIQILPSITEGLKMSIFIRQIKSENYKFINLVLNNSLQYVASSQTFQQEREMMFSAVARNQLDQDDELPESLLRNHQFLQIVEKIKEVSHDQTKDKQNVKSQISTILNLQNSDYKVVFRRKMWYKADEQMKSSVAYKGDKYLIQLQFINVLNIEEDAVKEDVFKSEAFQKEQTAIQSKDSKFPSQKISSHTDSISLRNSSRTKNSQERIMQTNLLQIQEGIMDLFGKTIEKNEEAVRFQKKYSTIMSHKTPETIIKWRFTTMILTMLVIIAMITNIIISISRKQTYYEKKQLIRHYNQLMTDTSQILIALRQYNFYADVHGPDDPRIPYYISTLHSQQDQISTRMAIIIGYFGDDWLAYEFFQNGTFKSKKQNDYVLMANYVLSTITYLSRLQPVQMAFPFLMSRYDWSSGLSKSQICFLQAVYNGEYTCLGEMILKRVEIVKDVSQLILPIQKQLFIFPTIIGMVILFSFSLFSVVIENKSEKIKQKMYNILQVVPIQIVQQKIKSLQQHKQHSKQTQLDYQLFKDSDRKLMECITRTIDEKQAARDLAQKQKQNTKKKNLSNVPDLETQTNRQLTDEQFKNVQEITSGISDRTEEIYKKQEQDTFENFSQLKAGKKKSVVIKEVGQFFRPLQFKRKRMIWKVMFYVLICLPFFVYFIVIFAGGIFLNKNIMSYLQISSQLYYRKTNLQNNYLWTRQTAVYEAAIHGTMDWSQLLIKMIGETYAHQRLVQKLVRSLSDNTYLKKYLSRMQNRNICDQVAHFKPSIKFNISFTKEQCEGISQKILTKGLKPTIVYYLQSAIQIFKRYQSPGTMSQQKRIQLLDSTELRNMRQILSYLGEVLDHSMEQFDKDVQELIDKYIKMTVIYSSVSSVVIFYIFIAINYRWKLLIKQKKQIKSIVGILSYNSITKNIVLSRYLKDVDCKFYQ